MRRKPLVLMILDGWGHREPAADNAITQAETPHWDRLLDACPRTLLTTSGSAVGLPEGQMGNSEVGHMNLGAGRIVYQDLTRISRAIESGEFQRNEVLCATIDAAIAAHGAVHLMGLLSPGGVHSHEEQFFAAVRLAAARGAPRIWIHAFLDGRDTPPRSAAASLARMQALADELPGVELGTVTGRYYAMDRDQRWDRVERAFQALVRAEGLPADHAAAALDSAYARDEYDEFVQPTVLKGYPGVSAGDAFLFVNFRADRARELTAAFVTADFDGFARELPVLSGFATFTEYQADLPAAVAFPPETLPDLFGQVIAEAGMSQLRIAETEKYAHVTFFFNGGEEAPYPGEERILVPSPRVATYDLQPEMSAPEVGDRLAEAIRSGRFDVIICNMANPDMVGHTGSLPAAIQAVQAVDEALGKVCAALDETDGELLVTADHGNVEQMTDPDSGQAHTAHTTNPVPLVFRGRAGRLAEEGSLRDLAPTMLSLLGLPQPELMTGRPLVSFERQTRSVA